jgi:putative restriction endonuclease
MIFESDEHPCLLRAFRGKETIRMLVYIWKLTRGGPPGVRPTGEFRIQLTGVDAPLQTGRNFVTLLLGWHESLEVFTGFDVSRRPRVWGASPSVQIREIALREATRKGFGFYPRATREREIAVALSPDCFMDYAKNQARFHEFAAHPNEVKILNTVVGGEEDIDIALDVDLDRIGSHGRREVVRTVKERVGQENFRARVLVAYKRHCAMCALQLNLVVAAHIVPVNADGTNETSNGLALCYLHHEAYDRALVIADERYQIRTNEPALERLRRINRNSKEREFVSSLRDELFLPDRRRDHPSPEYLRRGMEIRGWPSTTA